MRKKPSKRKRNRKGQFSPKVDMTFPEGTFRTADHTKVPMPIEYSPSLWQRFKAWLKG